MTLSAPGAPASQDAHSDRMRQEGVHQGIPGFPTGPVSKSDGVTTLDQRLWAQWVEWVLDGDCKPATLMCAARWMGRGAWCWPLKTESSMTDMTRVESGYTGPGAGLVFKKFAEVRSEVGVLKAKKKDGVKFKVRSADELADRLRPELEKHGLLVYPVQVVGRGHVVDSGTLAEATVTLRVLCVEDGSYFDVQGFGLGADNQDKAGGKAGTYAWKTALVQALTAGGEKDTDDTDTPIQGGVRKPRPAGPAAPTGVTLEAVLGAIAEAAAARSIDQLKAAAAMARGLGEADQAAASVKIREAQATIRSA